MRKLEILLVEDDYLDVESVKRSLKKAKVIHNLHVAHNGADALALLTSNPDTSSKIDPDLILLDINMPKMNGIEFLKIIKNYYSLSTIKVYIITTSAEDFDKFAAQNLGVDGYILKPLDFENSKQDDTAKLLSELSKVR